MELTIALPILPGQEEPLRRLWQELEGVRQAELTTATARHGLAILRVGVLCLARSSFAIAVIRGERPAHSLRQFARSSEPFDVWSRGRLAELFGIELPARFAIDEVYRQTEGVNVSQ